MEEEGVLEKVSEKERKSIISHAGVDKRKHETKEGGNQDNIGHRGRQKEGLPTGHGERG